MPSFRSETVVGINFHTNGGLIGGLAFAHSRFLTSERLHFFSLEVVGIKHPKERRYQNQRTGNSFIYGKQNYLYTLRPQYGRAFILFQKAKEQGIRVSFLTAAGPAVGFVAPYLIEVAVSRTQSRIEQYDPVKHKDLGNILGTGSFMESLASSKIRLGASLKMGMSFEFGAFASGVTGFEAGIVMDAYPKEIVIIPTTKNKKIYNSIYLTFFFGIRK